jgi:Domain of unknown function (DUF4386)
VNTARKLALATGIFFVITIIASIPAAFVFYAPVLNNPDYILGAGADNRVFWGAFLEMITALACIGTAVALFPIVKKQNEAVALGYVAVRVLEATIIVVGIASLLSVVTLRQDLAGASGADAASLGQLGQGLIAFHDATFLLGPGVLAGLGNGILLGYLMYRSGLVPRRMALLGLVGGPLVTASGIAVLFGLYEQVSPVAALIAIPETLWEASLGIWLIVKGLNPSAAILSEPDKTGLKETDEKSLARA